MTTEQRQQREAVGRFLADILPTIQAQRRPREIHISVIDACRLGLNGDVHCWGLPLVVDESLDRMQVVVVTLPVGY